MPSALVRTVTLVPHRDSRCDAVRAFTVRVSRALPGMLAVTFVIEGDTGRLRLPPPAPPRMSDGLWGRTCCELFVAGADASGYHELNFAPSGEWAAYAFESYRRRAPLGDDAKQMEPDIRTRRACDRFELNALVHLERLAPELATARLKLAVAAVVEDGSGALSYWALAHVEGKPDFHHPDAFALALDEARH